MNYRENIKRKFENVTQATKKGFDQCIRGLRIFLIDYCKNSTIHGLRYFSDRNLHWGERVFWLISIGIALSMCGLMIQNVWMKWRDEPMTFSFTEKSMRISSIPFPTVTICSQIKSKKKIFDLSTTLKSLSNLSDTDSTRLKALAHICPTLSDRIEFSETFANKSIYRTIEESLSDMTVPSCTWQDILYLHYIRQFTEDGLCYTFNALNSQDLYTDEVVPNLKTIKNNTNNANWSLEHGYNKSYDLEDFPKRVTIPGHPNFDIWFISRSTDFEYHCGGAFQGFKVALTTPGEVVRMPRNSLRVSLSNNNHIAIKAKLTTTSEGLRNYKPSERQCFYNSERRLRFYKLYLQSNCEMECLVNFTRTECGCVPFFMPRDKNTRICGASKIDCYKTAEKNIFIKMKGKSFRDKCNCLPACTSIEYSGSVDQARVDLTLMKRNYSEKELRFKTTTLSIYFVDHEVTVLKRIEMYTFTDFLAICGSLLGLYMGFSALSFIEIIYYCTLRLFWMIHGLNTEIVEDSVDGQSNKLPVRCLRAVWKFKKASIKDLCDNSNIHGLCYFTKRTVHWSERFWWLIAVGLSLWLCSSFIQNTWTEWQENPVRMQLAEKPKPISTIPFPTVTICPETKFYKKKIPSIHFTEDKLEEIYHIAMVHLCSHFGSKWYFLKNLSVDESIYNVIEDIALNLEDTIHKCWWRGQQINCKTYFSPVFTEEGLCYSFNALNSRQKYAEQMVSRMMTITTNPNIIEWKLENDLENKSIRNEYPLRATDSGRVAGLDLILTIPEEDIINWCNPFNQGFRIDLSVPGNELKRSRDFIRVPFFEHDLISIKPKLTTTSDALRKYTPNQRQCFYDSERQLRFYKKYSQINCEIECLANHTKDICGCEKWFMPRDNDTDICSKTLYIKNCSRKVDLKLNLPSSNGARADWKQCNCLQACTSIEYISNIDRVKMSAQTMRSMNGYNDEKLIGKLQTRLTIFFETDHVEEAERMEVYTFADFLAICGGLLGLFLGISALSIVELIYFFTLRVVWNIRWARLDKWENANQNP